MKVLTAQRKFTRKSISTVGVMVKNFTDFSEYRLEELLFELNVLLIGSKRKSARKK